MHGVAWRDVLFLPGPGPWLHHGEVEWSFDEATYGCTNCGHGADTLAELAYVDSDDPRVPPELRKDVAIDEVLRGILSPPTDPEDPT